MTKPPDDTAWEHHSGAWQDRQSLKQHLSTSTSSPGNNQLLETKQATPVHPVDRQEQLMKGVFAQCIIRAQRRLILALEHRLTVPKP